MVFSEELLISLQLTNIAFIYLTDVSETGKQFGKNAASISPSLIKPIEFLPLFIKFEVGYSTLHSAQSASFQSRECCHI